MPHGADITDPIPYPLSNPVTTGAFGLTSVAYDIAIAGQPFFLETSDETPYRRVTAQYRKQQLDTTREPGEQTLTGWWIRSQSTFHLGQGVKFFEPAQDESLRFQYTYSKGCDIWSKGQVTLLKDVDSTHITTGAIRSNLRPSQYARSIQWDSPKYTGATTYNTYDAILLADNYDLDKIYPRITATISNKALTSNVATLTTSSAHGFAVGMEIVVSSVGSPFDGTYTITTVPSATTFTYAKVNANVTSAAATGSVYSEVTHFVNYTSGTDDPIYAMTDDGTYAYWVTNDTASGKLEVNKKLLSDPESVSPTVMFNKPGLTVTNAVIEYTKERLVMCVNDSVYEFASTATVLPTAVYKHNDPDHIFTSITSSGAAIYLSGYSGIQSNIYKFTLSTTGSMPTLTSAITAAELPTGETVFRIYYYLGYMAIGTNQGVRIAAVSDTDGSINYGPLIFESEQTVYDFAARNKFLWCTTNVDGAPGVTRINLGQEVSSLVFAYAWDIYEPTITSHSTTACAFIGNTNRLAFVTDYANATNGHIYIEMESTLIPEAEFRTGFIRYNTLEHKIFKLLTPRFDTTNGNLEIFSVAADNTEFRIGTFTQGSQLDQVGIPYPQGPQQYLGFKFVMTRSDVDATQGPLFTGYQVNSLPSIPRQRLIQFPVMCFDGESDKFNNKSGYEGSAYDRMSALEQIENVGDTIRVQDFRTGESFLGIIEEMDFTNKTPTDKRFTGYGGVLLVTIRSI